MGALKDVDEPGVVRGHFHFGFFAVGHDFYNCAPLWVDKVYKMMRIIAPYLYNLADVGDVTRLLEKKARP
jgi:hypothetical protein